MKWNEKDTLKFVELYRASECLWNMTSPNYKIKNMRQKAIANIVKEMAKEGFGIREAKQKIKNIRSTYYQELLKIKKSKSGTGFVYVPSVKWFPILAPVMNIRRGSVETPNNVDMQNNDNETGVHDSDMASSSMCMTSQVDDDLTDIDQSETLAHESTYHPGYSIPSSSQSRGHKRRFDEFSPTVTDVRSMGEILGQPIVESDEDEIDVFGQYVSKSLRKLSTHDAICAQQEIQGVLTKYRLGVHQTSSEIVRFISE